MKNRIINLETIRVVGDTIGGSFDADTLYEEAEMNEIRKLRAALERIGNIISDAIQADCENGVKYLNEIAAAEYLKAYPNTKEALYVIQDLVYVTLDEDDD